MKNLLKFISVLILCFSAQKIVAQNFTVLLNGKASSKGKVGASEKVGSKTVAIKAKNLKTLGFSFTDSETPEDYILDIIVTNAANEQVMKIEHKDYVKNKFSFDMAEFKKGMTNQKVLHVHIIKKPADPNVAALVRLRMLYTVSFKF
jgi:hypothetical protein